MTAQQIIDEFPYPVQLDNIQANIEKARIDSQKYLSDDAVLQTIFNSIDLTTLSATDSASSVRNFVSRVNSFAADYPDLKNVGGICVYAVFAPILKSTLRVESVHRAVVAACFPSSQTFTDIKVAEVAKAVSAGATEVDVVISVGEFLDGNYEFVLDELRSLRTATGSARLKVILETGALTSHEEIWIASLLAMEASADFIKTSTGKNCSGVTPEAAYVMCSAIAAFAKARGRKVGFKPAGGISSPDEAVLYYEIVRSLLGTEQVSNNTLFRIGASRLANSLLQKILTLKGRTAPEKYF